MTPGYSAWSGPARGLAVAVDAAVAAAIADNATAFAEALLELRRLDRAVLGVLLGALTRDLLERTHPDGLDSDDAQAALESTLRRSGAWYPDVHRELLITALTGALGVLEVGEGPAPDDFTLLVHGVLLIADQLVVHELLLPPLLDSALRELMREQTVELP
jgi:hypothetical protein